MAANKAKAKPVVEGENGNYGRSYFRLSELKEQDFTVEQLLDLGANRKLALSFVVAERLVLSGEYLDDEGGDECIQGEGCGVGPVPLLPEYVWQLIAEGKAVVTYILRVTPCDVPNTSAMNGEQGASWRRQGFNKFEDSPTQPLPVVKREDVIVTTEDWERFQKKLPPIQNDVPKKECPKIIAALAYVYAESKPNNKNTYFDADGRLRQAQIANDINEWCKTLVEDIDGIRRASVCKKIKDALDNFHPQKK